MKTLVCLILISTAGVPVLAQQRLQYTLWVRLVFSDYKAHVPCRA